MFLSKNQESFLKERNKSSRQLFASEIQAVARHYKKKHHISIYKNGETDSFRKIIEDKQKVLHETLTTEIESFEGEKKYVHYAKYAGFIVDSRDNGHDLHQVTIGKNANEKLKNLLNKYLKYGAFRRDLIDSDNDDINKIIANDLDLKVLFDFRIKELIDHLKIEAQNQIQDVCLSSKEVWQEIDSIQKNLKESEVVGYVFTNGKALGKSHFEVLMITKNAIIKPVSWYGFFNSLKVPNQCPSVRFDSPSVLQTSSKIPQAHTDNYACGTIGLMYLKQLLKNNTKQLNEYSLSFPFYDKDGKVSWFFYPSPHVLQYSQSSIYNELLVSMLNDDKELQHIEHNDAHYQIATLIGLLQKSIEIAKKEENQEIVKHNSSLLEQLPKFREKWLEVYQIVSEKRKTMETLIDNRNVNVYLTYASHRITNHANEPEFNSKNSKLAEKERNANEFFYVMKNTVGKNIKELKLNLN